MTTSDFRVSIMTVLCMIFIVVVIDHSMTNTLLAGWLTFLISLFFT